MCTWSGMRCPSRIWHSFCWAKARNTGPNCRRMFPKIAFRRRLGTNTTWYFCSPTWSGLGFDTILTFILFEDSSSHLEEDPTLGTVKPLRVTLVEPVAYQSQLSSVITISPQLA